MGRLDNFYFMYMVFHVPITIFVDSSLVIPPQYQLEITKSLLATHLDANKDFLLVQLPLWLKVFGAFELAFQLPLFFYCAYAIWRQTSKSYYVWMTVYGFNAMLTTLVCMVYVWVDGEVNNLTLAEVYQLEVVYSPYLVIPLIMMVDHAWRITKLLGKVKVE